jgi:hypothetical protein
LLGGVASIFNIINKMQETQNEILENQSTMINGLTVLVQVELQKLDVQDFDYPPSDGEVLGYNWFTPDHERLLEAISTVESNNNPDAIGDNGNAIGSFQIWEPYWHDAVEHDPSIGGTYEDVKNSSYARKIVLAYWDRYGTMCGYSLEGLARQHNGGPRGFEKRATDQYWKKVSDLL